MKRIFTLLLFVLAFTAKMSAQFTEADIKFWVGEGPHTAVLVVDFRDGTNDPSFAWGFRYDEADDLTFLNMLEAVAAAEPEFTIAQSGGFLNDVIYNHHSQLAGEPDWWSTWSGESLAELSGNGGVSEELVDGRWYGLSYGFMGEGDPHVPTVTYAAYSSLWFVQEDVLYWVGEGENESVIVIDFNNESGDTVSYAWGVRYNGAIIASEAFALIADEDDNLDITFTDGEITNITYNSLEGNADENGGWHSFIGTNMSDWVVSTTDEDLTDGEWFGVTFGDASARRPFWPVAAQDGQVGVNDNSIAKFSVYPNPVVSVLNITAADLQKTEILNIAGQLVKSFGNTQQLDMSDLNSGIYFVKVYTTAGSSTQKVIKN